MTRIGIVVVFSLLLLTGGCAIQRQTNQLSQELDEIKAMQKSTANRHEKDTRELRATLKKLDAEIRKLQQANEALRLEFKKSTTKFKADLNEKTSTIAKLNSDLEHKNKAITNLTRDKTKAEIELRDKLRKQKDTFEEKIKVLERQANRTAK